MSATAAGGAGGGGAHGRRRGTGVRRGAEGRHGLDNSMMNSMMDSAGFLEFARKRGIVPGLLSRFQTLEIYKAAVSPDGPPTEAGGGAAPDTMTFEAFLVCLCQVAQMRYGDRDSDGWSDADKSLKN
eukprot:g4036.t1